MSPSELRSGGQLARVRWGLVVVIVIAAIVIAYIVVLATTGVQVG